MNDAKYDAGWRSMVAGDLDAVVGVARVAFPDHFEDRACFAERLALYPRGCFVLDDAGDAGGIRGGGAILGYLIAYPWTAGSAPPLDSLIGALPVGAEVLYLHDLALQPSARGRGVTRAIVERLVDQARGDGWRRLALVAVNQATGFWTKLGFRVVDDPALAAKLASYGADANYMVRDL